MACAVYCLVPRPDQIDDLVDRLRDAGVASGDISVVLRDGMPAEASAAPSSFAAAWWNLPLVPMAWMWSMSMAGWTGGQDAAVPAGDGRRTVIPLARYRREPSPEGAPMTGDRAYAPAHEPILQEAVTMDLTREQLQTLTQQLNQRRDALLELVRDHATRMREDVFPALAGSVGDDADQAMADLLRDTDNAVIGRDVRELREIESALQRIAEGEYGSCTDCGQPIGFPRLQAHPTAARCIRCQTLYERTYAHPDEPSL